MKKVLAGFAVIIILGAALTFIHWSLLIVAGILGGYLIKDVKKSALLGFLGGIISWSLLLVRYILSDYFSKVNAFINAVAGLPALPLTLKLGGIFALLGALIGAFARKVLKPS